MIGQRFGKIVVTAQDEPYIEPSGKRRVRWVGKCDCGRETHTITYNLTSGRATSCGKCHLVRHGCSVKGKQARSYIVWQSMVQRCEDKNADGYHRYGGRGITVCERWHDFRNFLADMGERPKGLTLDRIKNERGYEPNNCRWATPTEQGRNRSTNQLVELQGQLLTLAEVAEKTGLKKGTLYTRFSNGERGERLVRPSEGRLGLA